MKLAYMYKRRAVRGPKCRVCGAQSMGNLNLPRRVLRHSRDLCATHALFAVYNIRIVYIYIYDVEALICDRDSKSQLFSDAGQRSECLRSTT